MNGIDFLEVEDDPAKPFSQRQRTLDVNLIKQLPVPGSLTRDNVRIEGGERIRRIEVKDVDSTTDPGVVTVELAEPGDFSPYTLRLVKSSALDEPPDDFDPILSSVEFSFKVNCESKLDCRQVRSS